MIVAAGAAWCQASKCVQCERSCFTILSGRRIHRACNNARIEEQRTKASHDKRARTEESSSLSPSPLPRPTQRRRTNTDGDDASHAAATAAAADVAGALFALHAHARYVGSIKQLCWSALDVASMSLWFKLILCVLLRCCSLLSHRRELASSAPSTCIAPVAISVDAPAAGTATAAALPLAVPVDLQVSPSTPLRAEHTVNEPAVNVYSHAHTRG
jgi:hypothetical protein